MQIPTQRDVDISKRSYNPGDEDQIVDLLNRSFGEWGDIQRWRWKHTEFPAFENDNIYVVETGGSIIGHRGLIFRDIVFPAGEKIRTASIADTAVDPHYSGCGIYKKLHIDTMEIAKSKNACIMFSWNGKGSTTYKNNKKTGFIDLEMPIYIKILNPRGLIQDRLKAVASKNTRLSGILVSLGSYIYITGENETFCIIDTSTEDRKANTHTKFKIILDITAFNMLVNARFNHVIYIPLYLFRLLLSSRLQIKFFRP